MFGGIFSWLMIGFVIHLTYVFLQGRPDGLLCGTQLQFIPARQSPECRRRPFDGN
jgi:hypothetical protein